MLGATEVVGKPKLGMSDSLCGFEVVAKGLHALPVHDLRGTEFQSIGILVAEYLQNFSFKFLKEFLVGHGLHMIEPAESVLVVSAAVRRFYPEADIAYISEMEIVDSEVQGISPTDSISPCLNVCGWPCCRVDDVPELVNIECLEGSGTARLAT